MQASENTSKMIKQTSPIPAGRHCLGTRSCLEVSNRVAGVLDTRGNVPVFDQASANHPPDVCDHAHSLYAGNTLEVGDREIRAGGIGADEDVLNLDGAGAQHGSERLDCQCDAVARNLFVK